MPTQIIDGFRLSAATPIDTRMVTNGLASRNALQYKYEGLRIFDISDKKAYVWLDSSWQEDGVSTIGSGAGGGNGINSSIKGTQNYISKFTSNGLAESSIREQNVNGQWYVGVNVAPTELLSRQLVVGGVVKATAFEGALKGSDLEVQSVSPTKLTGGPSGGTYLMKSVNGQNQWVAESTSATAISVENETAPNSGLLTYVTGTGTNASIKVAQIGTDRSISLLPSTGQLAVSSNADNDNDAPGYAFLNETKTGLYGNSTEIGLSFKGIKRIYADSTQVTICKSDGTAQVVVNDNSVTINTALTAASMNITTLSVGGLNTTSGMELSPLLVVKSKGLPATVKTPYVDENGEVRDGANKIISGIPATGGSIYAQAWSPSYLYSDGGYPAAFFVATSDPVGLKTDTGVNNRIRFFRQNPDVQPTGLSGFKYKSEIETGTIGMRWTSGTSYIIDIRNFTAEGGVYIDAGAGAVQLRTSGGTYFEDIQSQTFNGTTDKRHVYIRKGGIDATGKTEVPGWNFQTVVNGNFVTIVRDFPAFIGQDSDTTIQLDTTNLRIKYNSPIEYVYSKTFVSKNDKQLALDNNAAVLNNATAVFKGNDVGLAIGAYGQNAFSNYGIWLQTVRDGDNATTWNMHLQPRGGTVQMGNTTVPSNFFVLTTNGGIRLNKGMQVFTGGYGIAFEDRPTKKIIAIRNEEETKLGSRYEVLRLQSQDYTHFIMQRHGTRVTGRYSHGGVFSSVTGTAANRRLLSSTNMWLYSDDWGTNETESAMTGILNIKTTETSCPGKQYDRILYFWSGGDIATTLYFNFGNLTVGDYFKSGENWVEMFDGQSYDGQSQWIIPAFMEFKLKFRKGLVGTVDATVLIQRFGNITSSTDVGE